MKGESMMTVVVNAIETMVIAGIAAVTGATTVT